MLRDDINNAVKEAMKAKNERKLSTLRMVNSTIKNADIEARGNGKPPLSDEIASGIPGAKLVVLSNCGHLPQLEQPQATADALVEWVRN